ncbi:hypothetical protein GDO86_017428 [Hymenochirus boettgeri]|uniref:Uncharacterized protein n=1 Tax=Hymenochirus boettgeri TaxID=247094 RepID=A0A8T2IK09_9PIPI|nr:hypothetical protein GDO86_017428 [Hymenochirus boettgeri]
MASSELRKELNCSICLGIYTDPAMLKCGHNFCQECIENALDVQEECGTFTCPECREEFQERPVPLRNLKLFRIAEHFLETVSAQRETGIHCPYCQSNLPADKTSLHCAACLCDIHPKPHCTSAEHVLTDPGISLDNKKCSIHSEALKCYCCDDDVCICMSCGLFGDHRGHQVELLNEARLKKKTTNQVRDQQITKMEETMKLIQRLEMQVKAAKEKTSVLSKRVTGLFVDIKGWLGALEQNVHSEILRQEEQISHHIAELIQQLVVKKNELSRKMLQTESLHMIDPLMELLVVNEDSYYRTEGSSAITLTDYLNEDSISKIIQKGLFNFPDFAFDLMTKKEFPVLEVPPDISLDITTANNYINISDDLKSAFYSSKSQSRLDEPQRFISNQVLSIESFSSGQHYWEVDVSKAKVWNIGVAYQSIERKMDGPESFIGFNEKSWSLAFQDTLGALHNAKGLKITPPSTPQTVCIYLNYEDGWLSFYQKSDIKRHLHTFTANFTEPLHAAFFIPEDSCITVGCGRRAYRNVT